jgi:hypothetical protein
MRSASSILYNFHWVVPREAARSAQAYLGFLGAFLRANGIKALINLRGRHPTWRWWRKEDRICRTLGVAHYDATLNSRYLPTRAMLIALFDAFDAAPRPFLIKCSGGQDRSSFAAALYIVHSKGWSALEEARVQFSRLPYLHLPKRDQRWLKQFLDYARSQAEGAPIALWVRTGYEPAGLADWLAEKGLRDSFRDLFETLPV